MAGEESQIGHVAGQLEFSIPHGLHDFLGRLQVYFADLPIPDSGDNIWCKFHLIKMLDLVLGGRLEMV